MLILSPMSFLIAIPLFVYDYLLSSDVSLCTCIRFFDQVSPILLYISASVRALGTPSKFSSVPILVADELASFPSLVKPNPRGILSRVDWRVV